MAFSDWEAVIDEESGDTYYHDRATAETSWEKPAGFGHAEVLPPPPPDSPKKEATPKAEPPKAVQPVVPPPSFSDWTERTDPGGNKFYFNTATKDVSWVKPGESEHDPDWEENTDSSGKTYFYNPNTGATSWTKPKAKSEADEWSAKADPAGNTFYHNHVTKETTWDKPLCLGGSPGSSPRAAPAAKAPPLPKKGEAGWKPPPPAPRAKNPPPPTGERRVVKDRTPERSAIAVSTDPEIAELAAKFAGMEFSKFAQKNFQLYRKGMFKTKSNVDKMIKWKDEVIKMSLMEFENNDSMQKYAIQVFRNVTGFMGDRGSSKAAIDHCLKLQTNMKQAPEGLRNECYCHIVKQTNGNPGDSSTLRGWQLFAVCLSSFPMSRHLAPHLGWYAAQAQATSEITGVRKYAEFCLKRINFIIGMIKESASSTSSSNTAWRDSKKNDWLEPAFIRIFFMDPKFGPARSAIQSIKDGELFFGLILDFLRLGDSTVIKAEIEKLSGNDKVAFDKVNFKTLEETLYAYKLSMNIA